MTPSRIYTAGEWLNTRAARQEGESKKKILSDGTLLKCPVSSLFSQGIHLLPDYLRDRPPKVTDPYWVSRTVAGRVSQEASQCAPSTVVTSQHLPTHSLYQTSPHWGPHGMVVIHNIMPQEKSYPDTRCSETLPLIRKWDPSATCTTQGPHFSLLSEMKVSTMVYSIGLSLILLRQTWMIRNHPWRLAFPELK